VRSAFATSNPDGGLAAFIVRSQVQRFTNGWRSLIPDHGWVERQ